VNNRPRFGPKKANILNNGGAFYASSSFVGEKHPRKLHLALAILVRCDYWTGLGAVETDQSQNSL
jgi:hypothetical protein